MQEELEYLYNLERLGVKPGLVVMEQLMNALGNPDKKFKSIHVTGTNGKGSTCAMIESVLRTAGYQTALYTSPHLYAFNERIRIAGVEISDDVLLDLIKEIRACVEKNNIQPTFFEFTTALAFLYFSKSNIDIAIIEVGMGGRYDATNVITPILSVITNVSLDHMEYLGDTREKIAYEKAGIIKEGVPVVTAELDQSILDIFDAEAQEKHTSVMRVQDSVSTRSISADFDGQEVEVTTKGKKYSVHLPLLGAHQITNMATAITAITVPHASTSLSVNPNPLPERERGTLIPDAIISGIANTKWEGRMQIVSTKPLIIVDGAHNEDGARVLADFLKTVSSYDVLIYAEKKGKHNSTMMELIIPLFDRIIVTEGSFMPKSANVIAEEIRALGKDVEVIVDAQKATMKALSYLGNMGTLVITGSLYMIPDALNYIQTVALHMQDEVKKHNTQ